MLPNDINSQANHKPSKSYDKNAKVKNVMQDIDMNFTALASEDLYHRPGKISNKDIIQLKCEISMHESHSSKSSSESSLKSLKYGLKELYDYVIVSQNIWNYMKIWYGYDYSIPIYQHKEESQFSEDNIFADYKE